MKMKKIILSYGRAFSIKTHKLLERGQDDDYFVAIRESQLDDYSSNKTIRAGAFITIPDTCDTLAKTKNYLNQSLDCDVLFLDDDIEYFCSSYTHNQNLDPHNVHLLLDNVYQNSKDLGVGLYTINQSGNILYSDLSKPFTFVKLCGSVCGVNDKSIMFDENLIIRCDADYTIQNLIKHRIILCDNRFAFYSKKDTNVGGSTSKSKDGQVLKDKQYLINKWGRYIKFGTHQQSRIAGTNNKDQCTIRVTRKQRGIF